jgi:Ca2+-transporting ATPase
LGRDIYGKITGQIRYVVSNLFAVLSLFIIASLFGINDGNVMYPVQLLFVIFFIGMFPAVGISTDSVESGIMQLPPRDSDSTILNNTTILRWFVFGLIQAVIGISPYVFASDLPVSTQQTLTFAIMSVSTIFMAISLRRDLTPGWFGPYFPFLVCMLVPAIVTWLAVDWPLLQQLTHTTGLTGEQWGAVIGLSILPAIAIEFEKTHRGALLRLSRLKK